MKMFVALLAFACLAACDGTSGGNSSGTESQRQAERVDDPAGQIMEDVVANLDAARKKWVGRYIEFKFWPTDPEDLGGDVYRFTGQDTPFTCDVDKHTYEQISLRQTGEPFIIVRGTVGDIDLDKPIELKDCQVVSLDPTGWQVNPNQRATSTSALDTSGPPASTSSPDTSAPATDDSGSADPNDEDQNADAVPLNVDAEL